MPERAALVTGASSGIGYAIARMPGEEGHGLTLAARRPEKLAGAVAELRDAGCEIEEVAGNMAGEADIRRGGTALAERAPGDQGRRDRWTQAMNKELVGDGVKSVALCPGFVDTPMTEFVREHVPPEQMIRPEDISEAVRYLLKTSPYRLIPEIVFQRPGEAL